jgi:hypothetical protein
LSRLLVKPPTGRSEADVLKLASYLTSLQRFQEVPQPKLVQLAKEVTYAELAVGTLICRQGILFVLSQVYAVSAGFVAASKAHSAAGTQMSVHCKHCCLQASVVVCKQDTLSKAAKLTRCVCPCLSSFLQARYLRMRTSLVVC